MDNKFDRMIAEKVRTAKRVSIVFSDRNGCETTLKLEPFMFNYISSALKSGLFVREKVERSTGRTLYQ